MTILAMIVAGVGLLWGVAAWQRRKHRAPLQAFSTVSGFSSYDELRGAIALAHRAGVASSQARHHRQFLVDMYGAPAVDAAASMLCDRTFDKRFPGSSLDAVLSKLSAELPDPEMVSRMQELLKRNGPPRDPNEEPKHRESGPHGDGLPF